MIFKLQSGGALPPFADYTPIPTSFSNPFEAGAAPEEKASSGKSDELGLKDLMSLIKDLDGLPNDANILATSLNNMINKAHMAGQSLDSSDIASLYVKFLSQINTAKFNKEKYNKAYEKVNMNGGLNEIAIVDNKVLAQDESGKMQYLDPEDLKEASLKGLHVLTNRDLLRYRSESSAFAFNNPILDIVANGIGLDAVNKMIKSSLGSLGTTTLSLDGYTQKQKSKIINGILFLQEAYKKGAKEGIDVTLGIDVEGLYELNLLTEDLAQQAQQALAYVYQMLPDNARTLLIAKTGSVEGSLNLISNLITSGTNNKFQFNSKLIKDKDGNISTGSGGKKTIDNDPVKSFILGKGYQEPIDINMGNSYTYTVNGRFSILTNKSGEALGANSTLEDVTNSAYAGVLDMNNATFGGLKLNTNLSQKILLDSADIIGMDLPVDKLALQKGIIRPDLDSLNRLELADSEIRENKVTDPNMINEIYMKHDLPPKYTNNGEINQMLYRRFARLSGIAEESALPEDYILDDTVVPIEDDNIRSNVEQVFKEKDKKYTMNSGVFGWGATELYLGAIYIPVRENLIAASLGSGDYYTLPNPDATSTERAWEENKKLQSYQKPPTLSSELNLK